MGRALFTCAILLVIAGFDLPAHAQNYPWCAVASGTGGGQNCGFSSYAQCIATVTGGGGVCVQNSQYVAPSGSSSSSSRRKQTGQ